MLSKRYESTEVDRRTWLHVPSGTSWSTSNDTHQVVEIIKETLLSKVSRSTAKHRKQHNQEVVWIRYVDPQN